MRVEHLNKKQFDEIRKIFLDVFSNEPWFDKWESNEQVSLYLHELIDNSNSLSLVFYDEQDEIIGGALGYIFHWWQGREYFIKEFFIARERQNQGMGKSFMNEISLYLESIGIKAIWLLTEKGIPAYHFYQKSGFSELTDIAFLAKRIT